MTTKSLAAQAALLVVCVLSGCGGEERRACGPDTCRGCCDADGMCQPGVLTPACGSGGFQCSACAPGLTCHETGWCVAPPVTVPPDSGAPAADAGHDGGAADAGPPEVDAGAPDADAGLDCRVGLLSNPGFECGLEGWTVLEGTGRLAAAGSEGRAALELTTDARGLARVALAEPLEVPAATTLCLAVKVRGTVPDVRLEVLVSPSNVGVSFGAPVAADWTRVPPSMLRVPVPAQSQVYVIVRAHQGAAGQVLEVDGLEVSLSSSGQCVP